MRYVWLNTVAATALALGVATAGAQMTEKEPKGFERSQGTAQERAPTQKDKAAPGARDTGTAQGQSGAPRQVGPGARGQAAPEQDRGTAQTQDQAP